MKSLLEHRCHVPLLLTVASSFCTAVDWEAAASSHRSFPSAVAATAFASPSIPPPPPLSMPVWSLSSPLSRTSEDEKPDDIETSMNIVTFATAVSVAPPKIWAVSLYTNTLTRRAFLDSKIGVLQLLRPNQSSLVPILGKRSGNEDDYSKIEACRSIGCELVPYCSQIDHDDGNGGGGGDDDAITFDVLPGCAAYVQLKLLSCHDAGDHDVVLCEVVDTAQWDCDKERVVPAACSDGVVVGGPTAALDPTTALYTGQLRAEGII
mmetsp:Transcript_9373/g.19927  ORF Transcript_9373/g.19927 Transcript_9373/m.19927 type:complete len:264 (+) Transcript_9373:99-890(+)